ENQEEQDLITRNRELIKTVNSEIWYNYVHNESYRPILDSFNSTPMTIEEICSQYPEDNQGKKKSNSTIYRYLKDLVDIGLVIDSGRRMYPNQVSSKILYDLAASMFIPESYGVTVWPSERGDSVAQSLSFMIKRHFGNKTSDLNAIKNLFGKFESDLHNQLRRLMEELVLKEKTDKRAQETVKEIRSLGKDADGFFDGLTRVFWFIQKNGLNELLSKIRACFRDDQPNPLSNDQRVPSNSTGQIESQDYQDMITYSPKFSQYVSEEIWEKMVGTYYHRAIMLMLRTPMTLKEIHKKHYEAVLRKIEDDRLCGVFGHKKKIPPKEKKENTIYGYLQDLKDWGLVVEAGRRITEGQSITQILYVRKAIYVSKRISYFDSEHWKKIVAVIGQAVQYLLQKESHNREKFYSLLTEIRKAQSGILDESYGATIANSLPVEMISTFSFEQHKILLHALELVEWLVKLEDRDELRSQFLNCFNS
ncbi:MAG: hypothetical protein ACFFBD_16290, partial [Candidatus Hodarchaeota archaeon]